MDVSALARYPIPAVAERLDELSTAGLVVTTTLMELELLGAMRDAQTYTRVTKLRQASVAVLETTEADIQRGAGSTGAAGGAGGVRGGLGSIGGGRRG